MRVKICNKVTKNKVFKIKKNIKRKGTSEKKKNKYIWWKQKEYEEKR